MFLISIISFSEQERLQEKTILKNQAKQPKCKILRLLIIVLLYLLSLYAIDVATNLLCMCSRTREVEALRQEITMLKSRLDRQPKPATLQDLEAVSCLALYVFFNQKNDKISRESQNQSSQLSSSAKRKCSKNVKTQNVDMQVHVLSGQPAKWPAPLPQVRWSQC